VPRPDLATIVDPAHTALLFQELQESVVGPTAAFAELAAAGTAIGLVPNAARLAAAARAAGASVVHATAENLPDGFGGNRNARLFEGARRAGAEHAPGSEAVQPVAGLLGPGDVILPRYHGLSPLTGGPLDSLLRNDAVTTIVLAGVSLNLAIPNVVFDAVNRSYQVVVVRDAVAGTPADYGEQVLAHSLALVATLTTTDELIAAWGDAAAAGDLG
jgi:nicotinamidase-related amidase